MAMRREPWLATALLAAALGVAHGQGPLPPAEPLAADGCLLERGPVRTVARVLDADTLALDDGTEVRLIGALAARPAFSARPWRIEAAAQAALAEFVAGRAVELGFSGRRTDRHGRLLAHVFTQGTGAPIWVQGHMLDKGLARVYGLPGALGCMTELKAREGPARRARIGLWADRAFAVLDAEPAPDVRRLAGTFQIVKGKVRKVERIRTRVYLNFGEDWRQDFTAGITLDDGAANAGQIERLEALAGKSVEVRGWIERRYGPFVEIWDESQIEVSTGPPAGGAD